MDSARPPTTASVTLQRLSATQRVGRGLARFAMVSGAGAVLALLPLLHGCGLVTFLIAGPVMGFYAFRPTVLLGPSEVSCPKCAATVSVAAKTPGWPSRLHCGSCGSTFFVRPAE